MHCDDCGREFDSHLAVQTTRDGPPYVAGVGKRITTTTPIWICPICARCRQRSPWFIAKVIIGALVAAGLFRLIYDWLR